MTINDIMLIILVICILAIVSILIANLIALKIDEREQKVIRAKIEELKSRKAEVERELEELKNSTEMKGE